MKDNPNPRKISGTIYTVVLYLVVPTFHSNFSVFLVYSLHGSGLISCLNLEIKLKIWYCVLASKSAYGAFWYLTECNNNNYRIRSNNTRVRIRHCRHCFRPAFLFSPYALLLISPLTSDFQLPVFK